MIRVIEFIWSKLDLRLSWVGIDCKSSRALWPAEIENLWSAVYLKWVPGEASADGPQKVSKRWEILYKASVAPGKRSRNAEDKEQKEVTLS